MSPINNPGCTSRRDELGFQRLRIDRLAAEILDRPPARGTSWELPADFDALVRDVLEAWPRSGGQASWSLVNRHLRRRWADGQLAGRYLSQLGGQS